MRIIILFLLSVQILAQEINWTKNTPLIRSYSSPRASDLNNDGVDDIILGGGVDGYPTPYGVIAINGNDGTSLWQEETRNEMFTSPQFFDYTNDGIDDVIIGGRDAELRLINGNTGETIWEFWDNETINPNDEGWYNFYTSQIIEDQNGDNNPDILVANGGDHSLDFAELDRPPGHIMIIDGLTGAELKTAVVPDSNETYMSPIICDLNGDSDYVILFGTGGEGVAGNLWATSLTDLLNEDISNAIQLIPNSELGHIAPPSIGDVNGDEVLDIITQGFDGKVTAIDGSSFNILWQYELENTESSASPILGRFSDTDNNMDVFATIYSGSMSTYDDYYQILLDGETGNVLWSDSLGMINFCSPIAFDSNVDGNDEVLISVINHNGAYFENDLILINFSENTQQSIIGPIAGGNVASTPQITDLDNNGLLDIICSVQADSLDPFGDGTFYENGINTIRISTPFTLPESEVAWGSYMGTHFDGHYNNGCDGELGLFAFPSQACPGENNGMINLYVSTGTGPYSYLWSNGETTEDLENLAPGLYSVTVTDASGACDVISREVNEYGVISFSQAPTCPNGNNGLAYFNSTGCDCNTSFCQFIWELDGDTIAQGDGSSAEETYKFLTNISSGTYTATIIHPDGCEIQEEIIVPEGELIDNIYIQNECVYNNNGFIDLTVNQSDSLLQNYLWNTGDTTQDIFNLSAGTYSVVISDTLCVDTLYFEVENIDLEELQVITGYDENGPIFENAAETYNTQLEIMNINNNVECAHIFNLWIETDTSNFSWSENGGILGEYESGDCNGDWCINIIESEEFSGWSEINLIFKTEGIYEFNTFINECPDYGNSIEITVVDSCDYSNIREILNPHIFLELQNQLIIHFYKQNLHHIEIFDMVGKKIIDHHSQYQENRIPLDNFNSGIYTIRITNENRVYTEKILIN